MHNLPRDEACVTDLHLSRDGVIWSPIIIQVLPSVASGNNSGCAILVGELGQGHDKVDARLRRIRPGARENWELPLVTMQWLGLASRSNVNNLGY